MQVILVRFQRVTLHTLSRYLGLSKELLKIESQVDFSGPGLPAELVKDELAEVVKGEFRFPLKPVFAIEEDESLKQALYTLITEYICYAPVSTPPHSSKQSSTSNVYATLDASQIDTLLDSPRRMARRHSIDSNTDDDVMSSTGSLSFSSEPWTDVQIFSMEANETLVKAGDRIPGLYLVIQGFIISSVAHWRHRSSDILLL